MLVMDDNNYTAMEPAIIPRVAPLDLSLPLRSLYPRSPRADLDDHTRSLMSNRLEDKTIESGLPEFPISSPMASSFRSSFSQESSADSSSTISTGPSTPRTPKAKFEIDDMLKVDWSYIPATHIPRTLKRKSEPLEDEDVKRVKLPGFQHLLECPENTQGRYITPANPNRRLQASSSSPEPKSEYVFSRRPSALSGEDPITQSLNFLRREKDKSRGPLPQIEGLSEPSLDFPLYFTNKFHRAEHQPTPERYSYCFQSHQQPSSPGEMGRKLRAKTKDGPHCNIKYLQEETDFLRYQKQDMKHSWGDITKLFRAKFPMTAEFKRGVQGVQGVHYRANKNIPDIIAGRNELVFLPNGHVAAASRKVRQQGNDRRRFGLVYLYPERAMKYSWVSPEDRRLAAELNRERIPQHAQAKRDAMKRGTWVEKFDDGRCACCAKDDRDKDNQK